MITNCMLAQGLDEERITYPITAEDKLDGFRIVFVKGIGWTRETKGRKASTYESFVPFGEAIHSIAGDDVTVDCELVASNWNETSKLLKRKHGLSPTRIKAEVTCYILDIFSKRTLGKTTYKERRKAVKKFVAELNALETGYRFAYPRAVIVKTKEGISKAFKMALARKVEGLVFKPANGVYELKRSFGWMKLKPWKDITVKVVGATESSGLCPACSKVTSKGKREGCPTCHGEGKVLRKGVLGALVCLTEKGKRISCGGGFTAAQRVELWKARKALLGKALDVKVQADAGNAIVARHINFVRWRPDR